MKKSELYHLAQMAVVTSPGISPEHKIDIIHILAADEGLAKYTEEQEEKKAADLRRLLGVQIDLLHDIFMSSSLPEYKKEEVGERIRSMKKELSSDEPIK